MLVRLMFMYHSHKHPVLKNNCLISSKIPYSVLHYQTLFSLKLRSPWNLS